MPESVEPAWTPFMRVGEITSDHGPARPASTYFRRFGARVAPHLEGTRFPYPPAGLTIVYRTQRVPSGLAVRSEACGKTRQPGVPT
jgi:hypothetical protein